MRDPRALTRSIRRQIAGPAQNDPAPPNRRTAERIDVGSTDHLDGSDMPRDVCTTGHFARQSADQIGNRRGSDPRGRSFRWDTSLCDSHRRQWTHHRCRPGHWVGRTEGASRRCSPCRHAGSRAGTKIRLCCWHHSRRSRRTLGRVRRHAARLCALASHSIDRMQRRSPALPCCARRSPSVRHSGQRLGG